MEIRFQRSIYGPVSYTHLDVYKRQSEHCPQIIYDKKALELKEKLPPDLLGNGSQSQYTLLASAARSANMDRFIQEFLMRKPDGVIVQLGCGLETTYYRLSLIHIWISPVR